MLHIHSYIVSRHLATRCNKKIPRTPPPHISNRNNYVFASLVAPLPSQNKQQSPFLKSYLHKVDTKSHPSRLCTLCNIHAHDTHHLFNCTHICITLSPLDLWTDPTGVIAQLVRWTAKMADVPQVGKSDSPPLARVMGRGRQQHTSS